MKTITIDCDHCLAPVGSCDDCVVQVMLDAGPNRTIDDDQQAALAALARAHMLPPLRLLAPTG